MGGFDQATWLALGLVLTLLGLGASAVAWSRRGATAGLRGVAWSLIPLAAAMTGVLRLGGDVAGAVGRWAVRLAFSPVVWLGLVLAGVSVLLFAVTGVLRRRARVTTTDPDVRARRGVASQPYGAPPARSAPPAVGRTRSGDAPLGEDTADVEAILRKHGIQ